MTGDKRIILRNGGRRNVSPFGLWSDMDDVFDAFRKDIDSMFLDPFGRSMVRPYRIKQPNNYMPMNLQDEGEFLELTVDMPGVQKDNIKLSLDEGLLTLSVDSNEENEEKDEGYLLKERSSYSCQRCIRIPTDVKEEDVEANMVDGVLHVKLPKVEPKKKEKTEIKVK